jgi:hypothetical protein
MGKRVQAHAGWESGPALTGPRERKESDMNSLHIENTVRDFDEWKAVFDKFDRFRAEKNVRSYRLARSVEDANQITIDMEFDSLEDATSFRTALEQIWRTPQSKAQMVAHSTPELYDVVEQRQL